MKAWPLLERIDLGPNRALCSLKQLRELARATNLVEMHAGYDMGFGDGAGVMDDLSIWTTVFTWFKVSPFLAPQTFRR